MVYGREVDGKTTTFGTTGYTYGNIFALYDRLSGSVWFPGDKGAFDAIGGPQKGAKIPFIDQPPVVTLGQWRQEHPNTEILLEDGPELEAG